METIGQPTSQETELQSELDRINAQIDQIDDDLQSTMYRSTSAHRVVTNGVRGRIERILEGASPEALDLTLKSFGSSDFIPKVHKTRWFELVIDSSKNKHTDN